MTGVDPSVRQVKDAQISSLTGMRGFAAIMVVVIHTAGRTDYPWLGVHGYGPIALFVLSGFLLYRPFSRWVLGIGPMPSLRNYSIRRVLRIFPAYWAVLHVWYFIYPAAVPSSFGQYLKELTLLNTLQYFGLTQGLQQAWSMGTELTWYVFVPVLATLTFLVMRVVPARLRVRVHVWMLLTSLPISAGWIWFVHDGAPWQSAGMWLLKYLVCFTFGALVAMVMEAERAGMIDISRGRLLMEDPWLLPLLAFLFALIGTSQFGGEHDFGFLSLSEELTRDGCAFGLAATLLLIAVFSPPDAPFNRFLATRWMQASGRWSYGIYLWHLPLIVMLYEDYAFPEGFLGLVVWLMVILPISYALGAASYAWVETPAMTLSKRLTPSRPRGGARAARRGTAPAELADSRGGAAQ
ncbi:acyltransferase [Nocardioides daphniae]|uniref:Acyltransferase n=1 Tax=Nocardioides daphniae TaxID=402297 RepID=A0ABQ1Q9E6_9ACTN|nr:acyltransferase [Nocardioides daphniae]